MRHVLFLLTLLWQLTQCTVLAQTPEKPLLVWLGHAQTETQQLAELALGYSPFDRANLYAQLGEFWWPVEPARGREWFQKAADGVTFIPMQTTTAHRQAQMRAVRAVLRRVGARDKELAARLNEALKTLTQRQLEAGQGEEAGNVLLDTAWSLADQEPGRAKELAVSALQAGGSKGLVSLLMKLRAKDARMADALFNETLILARARRDDELLRILVFVTGSLEELPAYKGPRTPEPLRLQALNVLVERLLMTPSAPNEQVRYCQVVLQNVIYQRERLMALFPERIGLLQQAFEDCQHKFKSDSIEALALSKAAVGEKLPDNPYELVTGWPKSVADKLALARKTVEPKLRTPLLWAASQQAASEGEPDEAIRILDGMSAEERQLARFWDTWRGWFAAQAAQKYLKQKEYGQARKVIDAVPQHLVAAAVIECLSDRGAIGYVIDIGDSVVGRVGERNVKIAETERDLFVEWLNLARSRLSQAESDAPGNQGGKYFSLVSLYAAMQPVDALPVLNEAVRALNRAYAKEQEREAKEKRTEVETDLRSLPPQSLPGKLVKESFDGVRSALHELDSNDAKTRLHLGLLQTALGFHQEELEAKRKAEAEQAKKKKSVTTKPE